MSPGRALLRNAMSGWASLLVGIPATLIVTPFVVNTLDRELYGVWSFVNGLLVYSDLLYFGLGSAIIKNVAQYRAQQDFSGIARLASVVTSIYGAIGVVCLLALLWLGTAVPGLLAEPLSTGAASQIAPTCALLGIQLFLVFVGSAFSGLICGYNRFDWVNAVTVIVVIVRTAATFALVDPGNSPLLRLATVTCLSAAVQTGLLIVIALRLVRGVSIRPTRPRLLELQYLYGFGLQSFFVMFAVRLISNTDTTVIGLMLGASSVAIYSLPLQLLEQAKGAVAALSAVLLPSVTTLAADKQTAAIREFYLTTTRATSFMAGWLAATAIALGPPFLTRWVGPEFGLPVQWVLVYLGVTMFCQNLSIHGPLAFYQALHLLRRPALVLVAEAVMNLGMSLWFVQLLGITGVALATVVPALLLSTAILPAYLCRQIGLPLRRFLAEGVGPGLLLLVATFAVQWGTGFVINSESYVGIGLRGLASAPIVVIVFLATFPKEEQRSILRLIGLVRPG